MKTSPVPSIRPAVLAAKRAFYDLARASLSAGVPWRDTYAAARLSQVRAEHRAAMRLP